MITIKQQKTKTYVNESKVYSRWLNTKGSLHTTSLNQIMEKSRSFSGTRYERNTFYYKLTPGRENRIDALAKDISLKMKVKRWKVASTVSAIPCKSELNPNASFTLKDFYTFIKRFTSHFPQLKKLDLSLFSWAGVNDRALTSLATEFGKNFCNLYSLRLSVKGWQTTDQGLQRFSREVCRNLNKLTKLHLDFSKGPASYLTTNIRITEDGIKALSNATGKYLTNLEALSVRFMYERELSSKDIEKYILGLGHRLTKLQRLDIGYTHRKGFEDSLSPIGRATQAILAKLNSLESVYFIIECQDGVNNASRCIMNIDVSKYQNDLSDHKVSFREKRLSLNFQLSKLYHSRGLDETFLPPIPAIIQPFGDIERLTLLFEDNLSRDLSDKSVEDLIFSASYSTKTLSINFSKCKLNSIQWQPDFNVYQTQKPVSSLQGLKLDFRNCLEINDTWIEAIGVTLTLFLPNLETLCVDLSHCQITGGAFAKFGNLISNNLVKLKALELKFGSWVIDRKP